MKVINTAPIKPEFIIVLFKSQRKDFTFPLLNKKHILHYNRTDKDPVTASTIRHFLGCSFPIAILSLSSI